MRNICIPLIPCSRRKLRPARAITPTAEFFSWISIRTSLITASVPAPPSVLVRDDDAPERNSSGIFPEQPDVAALMGQDRFHSGCIGKGCATTFYGLRRTSLEQWNEAGKKQPRRGRKSLAQGFQRWVKWEIRRSPVGTAEVATPSLKGPLHCQPHFRCTAASTSFVPPDPCSRVFATTEPYFGLIW